MKNITKLLISTIVASSLSATTYENMSIYKDYTALGMGGAITASGGAGAAMLSNPAALTKSNAKWEIGIIDLGIGTNENVTSLASASGEPIDIALENIGKNINMSINEFTHLTGQWDDIKFGLGAAINTNIGLKMHSGFGPTGLLELNTNAVASGLINTAYTYEGNVHMGITYKYSGFSNVEKTLDLGNYESASDEITDALNNLKYKSLIDLGVIYDIEDLQKYLDNSILDAIIGYSYPSIGLSVLNIGGGTSTSTDGIVPMTVNMGLSLKPLSWILINFDYQDILNGYEINESRGFAGKFRFGTQVAFDSWWLKTALRAGWMNGGYSAGADLFLIPVQISLTTYQEELGGYIGQMSDRRYLINLGLKF